MASKWRQLSNKDQTSCGTQAAVVAMQPDNREFLTIAANVAVLAAYPHLRLALGFEFNEG